MGYKLSVKDMVFLISVMILILFGLDCIGVDLSAAINMPSSDENTTMSLAGAMSGTIN